MNEVSAVMYAGLLSVLATACGAGAPESRLESDEVEQLEGDYGGPDGRMDIFATHNDDEIRQVLDVYGIKFARYALSETIAGCPQHFPEADRKMWHAFDGEFYYIDGVGRPSRAYKFLPPIVAEARITS